MTDDTNWKLWSVRQKVIQQIDDALRQNPKGMKKTGQEVENSIFESVSKREEYFSYVTRIISQLKEQDPNPNRGNASNLTAVLSGQPMATQQINQGATSGGQMTITTSGNQMGQGHQNTNQQIGQMMQTRPSLQMNNTMNMGASANLMTQQNTQSQMVQMNPSQGTMNTGLSMPHNNMPINQSNMMPQLRMQMGSGMVNQTDWQASKMRQQEILNVNQKHPGMVNIAQVTNLQTGKMTNMPVSMAPNEQLTQMSMNQMTRHGMMPVRGPSPNFQAFKVTQRQNVPVAAMQQHGQYPGINFISPSPSSAVPSPAGPGMVMGRNMGQQGVLSPSTGMLNTPGQQTQQASPANIAMDDREEYIEKVKELQHKYHDTLKEVAQRFAKSESEKARNVFNLLQVLENPQIRSSMETLRRCEEVLERIGNRKVNRDVDAARKDSPSIFLSDSFSTAVKTGNGVQAIQKSFTPIFKTLFPSDLDLDLPKFNLLDLLPNRSRDSKVTDTIQGEIARLHSRFKVNIDRELTFGDELVLLCHLDDVHLPYVPPVSLVIPPGYPSDGVPKFSFPSNDYRLTQFLRTAKQIMMCRLFYLPNMYTISMVLDAWELSVRQACNTKTFSDDSFSSPKTPEMLKQ